MKAVSDVCANPTVSDWLNIKPTSLSMCRVQPTTLDLVIKTATAATALFASANFCSFMFASTLKKYMFNASVSALFCVPSVGATIGSFKMIGRDLLS